MSTVARRICSWSAAGAVAALIIAVGVSGIRHVVVSLLIGAVAGAATGAAASVVAPKFLQVLFTGTVAGLTVGLLTFYFVGSPFSVWEHVGRYTLGFLAGFAVTRYGIGDAQRGVFASSTKI